MITAERIAKRTSVPEGLDARHVLAAAHQVLAESIAPKDGTVLERAKRIARAETPEAVEAWRQVRERFAAVLPEAALASWLSPIVVAAADSVLALAFVDPRVAAWSGLRYGRMADEAVRRVSDFRSVEFRPLVRVAA